MYCTCTGEEAINGRLARARQRWLRDKGLTVNDLARNTGNEAGTASRWVSKGRQPRTRYLAAVLAVYPDFPRES